MTEQKKRGRPLGSKNKPKDPMIAAIEKRRGRPAGTRIKRRTIETVRREWQRKYQDMEAAQEHARALLNDRCNRLFAETEELKKHVHSHAEQANKLIQVNDELRVVINYLENLLERTYNSVRGVSHG